jgi:hypothetical protein
VPQRAVAARQVALRRDGVIVGGAEDRRVAVLIALATRGRQRATFALAVVQRADDQRPVDIVFEKLHQYFLADARQELAAHAAAGRALRNAYPAGRGGVFLPVEANAYSAEAVAVDFIGAARARAAAGPDHDRALAAVGRWFRMMAQAVLADHRTPRDSGRDGIDQVGVAAGAGLSDDGGQFGILLRQCLFAMASNRSMWLRGQRIRH